MLAIDGPYQPHVDAAGFGKTVPITREQWRANCDYLLTYVQDESAVIKLADGTSFPFDGTGTWLIPPGLEHTIGLSGGGSLYWIHFSVCWSEQWWKFDHQADFKLSKPQRLDHLQPCPIQVWGVDFPYWLPREIQPVCEVMIPNIVDAFLAGESADRFQAHALLATFLSRLVDALLEGRTNQQGNTITGDEGRIRLAERMVRRHMGRDVSVEDMAREAGWSRTHFSSVYTRVRGESPSSFIRRLRLDEAAVLLRTQNGEISDVGSIVGYPDPSSFGRSFRRYFGMSPGEYRAKETGYSR